MKAERLAVLFGEMARQLRGTPLPDITCGDCGRVIGWLAKRCACGAEYNVSGFNEAMAAIEAGELDGTYDVLDDD